MSTYTDPFGIGDQSITLPDNATTNSTDGVNAMQVLMNTTPSEVVNGGTSNSGMTQEIPQTSTSLWDSMMQVVSPNATGGQQRATASKQAPGSAAAMFQGTNGLLLVIVAIAIIYFAFKR